MKPVLFCIPLKKGHLQQFKDFVATTAKQKSIEWKDMLSRYDISCVKIWEKNMNGRDYAFVYHEIGHEFEKRIKSWNTSTHPFDQWFDAQIMAVYDAGPVEANANLLLEL